ncbi:carbon-nitrogen hydrolase family protein [Pseudomonas fuscovaginae UPB0736]|uniref:Carbon-nitrogen hydrolase n=1 Tax=Pseudomonas asplenii TaxID=53407 RepID=A0A1H6P0B3_9PSED|nr:MULTISPECIES: nitrilase-related carbon-nitrogen hydrolase [Pseudomonas]UUQ64185.1 carbon-nitrogen hydrolase family protein [Pseudomonas fuscovaginae UPB0736]UZE27318.1 carbon-nitrogen hydrolase family protein [Pseudomonas asplenii]SDT00327.1 Carbon-nitrogen hydrolase [Pseudomonas asplenii]SEI22862.1 Carbon-nitrogen hydrolase [Pseudomonas fuscovaginae]
MRKFFVGILLIALIAALTSYGLWTQQRSSGHYLSDLRIRLALNQGVPGEHGNLLGIQPELFPSDYQSLPRLHRKLAAYLQQARSLGLLNARTVVVLPEHVGTWLVLRGEKDDIFQALNQQEAMNWLMAGNPLKFTHALFKAKGRSRLDDARLRMKAQAMASDYQALFGGLAKEFGVTLVAGTLLLPTPFVEQGTLKFGSGSLYNASLTFGADGRPLGQPQRQLYPTFDQRGYVLGAADQAMNVVDTPAGRLGILIGSDSWYPNAYRQLDALGVKLIAVPAHVTGKGSWERPWRGFRSAVTPPEIGLRPGELSEGEAWHRLTLNARPADSQSIASLTVFLRGQLWDQRSAGQSFISYNGQILTQDDAAGRGARLINLWLP